jgi:hypothetical protein
MKKNDEAEKGNMSTNRGRCRDVLAATLLTLETPILAASAVGAALAAVGRVAQNTARSLAAFAAPARSPQPRGPDRARPATRFGNQS